MRILLANKHYLGLSGGAERNISDMANWLTDNGHKAIIFSETKYGTTPAFPVNSAVTIASPVDEPYVGGDPMGDHERDPDVREWARSNRSMRRKWGESIRDLDPDVIITFLPHTATFLLYELGNYYPIIVTNQNDPAIDYYSDKHGGDAIERRLRIELLHRARLVHFLMPDFPGKMPAFVQRKSVVIPNVVHGKSPQPYRLPGRKIVAMGRLVSQKGFGILIESFVHSQAYREGWELHIFGAGPEELALRVLTRRLMAQRQVFLRGHTTDPDREMADADIFVIPSVYEGWGLTLTEAMAARVPSIGFADCSGVNWLIQNGENGLLAERSIGALAAAIDQLVSSPALRKELGEAGSRSVKRFAPHKIYGQWEAAIKEAVSGVLV